MTLRVAHVVQHVVERNMVFYVLLHIVYGGIGRVGIAHLTDVASVLSQKAHRCKKVVEQRRGIAQILDVATLLERG